MLIDFANCISKTWKNHHFSHYWAGCVHKKGDLARMSPSSYDLVIQTRKLICKQEEFIIIVSVEQNRNLSIVFWYRILGDYTTIIHSTPDQMLTKWNYNRRACRTDQSLDVTCLKRRHGIFNRVKQTSKNIITIQQKPQLIAFAYIQ